MISPQEKVDGVAQLTAILARAGYPSVVAAVAEHTLFLHPETVGGCPGHRGTSVTTIPV